LVSSAHGVVIGRQTPCGVISEPVEVLTARHVTSFGAAGGFFTPTYASWINQIERWSAELQRRCLERGVSCSAEELTTALQEWIKLWNEAARRFTWTRTADQIIDRICRYCSRISGPAH
jgi:transposase